MAERKTLNLKGRGADRKDSPARKHPPKKEPAGSSKVKHPNNDLMDTEDDVEDDDDELLADVEENSKSGSKMLFIVLGVLVVAVVVIVFLLFGGRKRTQATPVQPPVEDPATQQQVEDVPQATGDSSGPPVGLGTQDFTGDTTMDAGSVLTNPDEYVEDIYGLTTRVDYTVKRISYIADFVSYEKHRGTWGGGLELYWLDAEYKGNKYVVQVPFRYYKELDDAGIVPVKMEVLTIDGSAAGEELSVVSYMCLDEKTLSDILKNQSK